jgi:hypothetical protein
MTRCFVSMLVCCVLTQSGCAKPKHLTQTQQVEMMAMLTNVNHAGLTYRATVIRQMLQEANWAAGRLNLPIKHPIQIEDVLDDYTGLPWFSVLQSTNQFPDTIFGTHIFDTSIPREERLRALKIGISGRINITDFQFTFDRGRLRTITRMDDPETERYSRRLVELAGKPSLIDSNGAYQLATQWLAALDVDVPALEKQFGHSVNQLRYLPSGATNAVLLPLYYVGLGTNNTPKWKPASYDPAVEVEILGTTKELQDLEINDPSFSHRPLLLITNALDLIRTPNPSPKQLQNPATAQAYELTPVQVLNYTRNFELRHSKTNSVGDTNAPAIKSPPF